MNWFTWSLVLAAVVGLGVLESRNHAVSTFLATFLDFWLKETTVLAQPGK